MSENSLEIAGWASETGSIWVEMPIRAGGNMNGQSELVDPYEPAEPQE